VSGRGIMKCGFVCETALGVGQKRRNSLGLVRPSRDRNARQIALELRCDVGNHQDPVFLAHGVEHLLARARVITGDAGQCRPVDTWRRESLRRIGAIRAHPLLGADARLGPQSVKHRLALGIQPLHRQHRDVAMLGVNPGECRSAYAPCCQGKYDSRPAQPTSNRNQ